MLPTPGEEPKTSAQEAATAARERCKSPAGVWSYIQRMGDAEGVVGELKRQHGMDRARSRGTPMFHLQLLLGCSALNLKRIAAHTGQAASGAAAGPRTAKAEAAESGEAAPGRSGASPGARSTTTTPTSCIAASAPCRSGPSPSRSTSPPNWLLGQAPATSRVRPELEGVMM